MEIKAYTIHSMKTSERSDKLHQFLKSGKKISFKRKEVILHGDLQRTMTHYWITKGYVKVISLTRSGTERIHYIYGPNDMFPIGWLFGGSDEWVSFVALGNVSLITKSSKDFSDFISKEPYGMSEITRMQFNMHDRIYNLNLDSPEDRVAHCILSLAQRFGVNSGPHVMIDIPLTQQEFADMVRLSRETAGKVLNEMEDKGYIILGRRRILVYTKKLSEILEN